MKNTKKTRDAVYRLLVATERLGSVCTDDHLIEDTQSRLMASLKTEWRSAKSRHRPALKLDGFERKPTRPQEKTKDERIRRAAATSTVDGGVDSAPNAAERTVAVGPGLPERLGPAGSGGLGGGLGGGGGSGGGGGLGGGLGGGGGGASGGG